MPPIEFKNQLKSLEQIIYMIFIILIFISFLPLTGCSNKSEETEKVIAVQLTTAHPASELANLSFSGNIVPRVESQLSFRVAGRIIKRLVDTGALITKNQVLAQLDDTPFRLSIQEASAELHQAQSTLARVQRDLQRNRSLVEIGAISRADLDNLENLYQNTRAQVNAAQSRLDRAKNDLSYTILRSPAAGTIAEVQAESGQVVSAGTPIFKLAQNGENEVQIDVPENQINQLKIGQQASIKLLSLSEHTFTGRVREIATVADPNSRTYRVRISITNLPDVAKLGMSATVHFLNSNVNQEIILPISALFQKGQQTAVWVLPPGAKNLQLRPVVLSKINTENITVAKGIQAGERIVTAGVHRLDSKISVKAWDGRLP
ncbi:MULTISPECIES: efflux RND transporter periplasmic adaptor subunit [Acinetobacter]|uniref:efflux RND transporter periplasmic adaptor subunit n=1 Tax=Acinetobacter TaxID=469 RepID=UPI00029CA800|nr:MULTISPECIES: efflux RND transporter periplasmic adaptor subunit [Acinetobacter]EKU38087.1 efflux transporter, RND family, MFP subunit [Acinetobacter sp. WC-141]MBM7141693.1 efflux RND transporter periplasmic adaptor subunit [Acinetobacter sp. 105-3]